MATMPAKTSARIEEASAKMRAALAGYCHAMAELSGDGRWRQAAGVLTGGATGRRSVGDDAPLSYARTLLASGLARSVHHACYLAAQFYAPSHQVGTMRDRLRRKFRAK